MYAKGSYAMKSRSMRRKVLPRGTALLMSFVMMWMSVWMISVPERVVAEPIGGASPNIQWQKMYANYIENSSTEVAYTTMKDFLLHDNKKDFVMAGVTENNADYSSASNFWITKGSTATANVSSIVIEGMDSSVYDSTQTAMSVNHSHTGGYIAAGVTNAAQLKVQSFTEYKTIDSKGNKDMMLIDLPSDLSATSVQGLLGSNSNSSSFKIWGGSGDDELTSIIKVDGGYIVSGATSSVDGNFALVDKEYMPDPINENYGTNGYVAKLGTDLNIVWQKLINHESGNDTNEYLHTIRQVSDGYIAVGYTEYLRKNIWMVKLDYDGNVLWQKTIEEVDASVEAVDVLPDGENYVLVGSSTSNADSADPIYYEENSDGIVLFINSVGEQISRQYFGGSRADQLTSIEKTSDGGFIISGSTSSNDPNRPGTNGESDLWVIKLDAHRTRQWERTFGDQDQDYGCRVYEKTSGVYVLAGTGIASSIPTDTSTGVGDFIGGEGETVGSPWVAVLSSDNAPSSATDTLRGIQINQTAIEHDPDTSTDLTYYIMAGTAQQVVVTAVYEEGATRDVTDFASIEVIYNSGISLDHDLLNGNILQPNDVGTAIIEITYGDKELYAKVVVWEPSAITILNTQTGDSNFEIFEYDKTSTLRVMTERSPEDWVDITQYCSISSSNTNIYVEEAGDIKIIKSYAWVSGSDTAELTASVSSTTATATASVTLLEPPRLSSITIDDQDINTFNPYVSFDPNIFAYTVTLPVGYEGLPEIEAVSNNQYSYVSVSDPEGVPGKSSISVSLYGKSKVYKIKFEVQQSQLPTANVLFYSNQSSGGVNKPQNAYALKDGESIQIKMLNTDGTPVVGAEANVDEMQYNTNDEGFVSITQNEVTTIALFNQSTRMTFSTPDMSCVVFGARRRNHTPGGSYL